MNPYDWSTLETLAKLSLTEEERKRFSEDLDALTTLCRDLADFPDTRESALSFLPVSREDVPCPFPAAEEILASSPTRQEHWITVPNPSNTPQED